LIKERWQEFESEFDTNALGTVAQGLLALGDVSAAQAVVSAALDWQLPADDWEENDALGELARTLGKTGDSNGLAWILARARGRQTAWQQAELAYHVTGAAEETGDIVLAGEARQLMEAAALGKTGSLAGTNACGILAVWQVERQNVTTARELIAQAVEVLKEDPDGADALAYLALTLAYGQAPDLAGYVLQQAIGVLQEEFDPNTLARATGTAAEAAAALGDMETFDLLKTIAREIDDDWLQAEALFWIAGWQAVLGRYDEARQIYLAAAVSGLWQENSDSQVEAAWNEDNVDWIVNIAQSVGWPSTTAAAIFAGLALALSEPEPDWFDDGLLAIDQITEGYNHIRAVCHCLLLESAAKFPDQPAVIVNYWVLALAHNRGRDAGEVWAIMKAGIPVLYAQLGQLFVRSLWHELATVRNLFS
jgi:hypothetical protein